MISIVLIAVLCALPSLDARSDGNLAYCEIYGGYGKNTKVMPWVAAPVADSTLYSLRSGEGKQDPTTYQPGKLTPIHFRVMDLDYKYIGFLMYATNSAGSKVGTWTITPGDPFQLAPAAACYPYSVTHTDADLKPLHSRFYFSAPAGTGSITIHVLIKQGEQNRGSFFIVKPLTLQEAAPPAKSVDEIAVMVAPVGKNCQWACQQHPTNKYCNLVATNGISSPDYMLMGASFNNSVCSMPIVSGCSAAAPLVTPSGQCVFKASASQCSSTARTATMTTCSSTSSTNQRFCACSATANSTVNPFVPLPGPDPIVSSSLRHQPSSSTSLLLCLFSSIATSFLFFSPSSSSSSRSSTLLLSTCLMLILSGLIPSISAHNYVQSPSRALVASVANPCQARVGNQPHIQVASNQPFQMEWSVGHGDSSTKNVYWVAVHESDYMKLATLNSKTIDEYIASAPASAMWNGTESKRRHTHSRTVSHGYGYYDVANPLNVSANPAYITRDPIMIAKSIFRPANYDQYMLYDNVTSSDVRVAYNSSKYPFIESASRFRITYEPHNSYAAQSDLATFKLEGKKGPGNYIMWFYWGGYRDCVDINIYNTTVQNRYGQVNLNVTSTFYKLDHCELPFVRNPVVKCTVMVNNSADACLKSCTSNAGCNYVTAVRAVNAAGTLPYTVNLPYTMWDTTQYDPLTKIISGPCGYNSVAQRQRNGCSAYNTNMCDENSLRKAAAAANINWEDAMVCYGFTPHRDQDLQAVEDYEISQEPEDPKFYSTCWVKIQPGGFLDVPAPIRVKPPWANGERCISCDAQKKAYNLGASIAPDWTQALTNLCVDCDNTAL